jgi:regulatory protein
MTEDKNRRMQEAKTKLTSYCAYQERTRQEVEKKLEKLGMEPEESEQIIEELIAEKYLDESRFAQSYAGGKFRIKKWGKIKIRVALQQQGVAEEAIEEGLKQIDPEDYWQTLYELAEKKLEQEKESDPLKRKQKLVRYLAGKGYESGMVWEVVNEILD